MAAQDPGGANAVAPVAKLLWEEGRVALVALGARWAEPVFSAWKLPLIPAPGLEEGLLSWAHLTLQAARVLTEHSAQILLLGTSWGPSIEKALIQRARLQAIPSIAVLDSWGNYVERFSGVHSEERMAFLPDRIAVMDAFAHEEMVAQGFSPGQLVVTGQPAFDDLLQFAQATAASRVRQELTAKYGLALNALVVVFVSEPLAAIYGADAGSPTYLGYHEERVLRDIVAAIETLQAEFPQPLTLLVKAHPKEDPPRLAHGLRSIGSTARVLAGEDTRRLLLIADAVVGMSSIVLVESYLLGRPTISYQPGLRVRDPFVLTRSGLLARVQSADQLRAAVHDALSGGWKAPPVSPKAVRIGSATASVAGEVYSMLGLKDSRRTEVRS